MSFFRFKKDLKDKEQLRTPYEEISEKRTTKVGYFLLFVMVIFIVGISQTIFDDLEDLVVEPKTISWCSVDLWRLLDSSDTNGSLERNYYGRGILDARNCNFSEHETGAGIDRIISDIRPELEQLRYFQDTVASIDEQIRTEKQKYERGVKEYDLSLQERQSQVPGALNVDIQQQRFESSQQTLRQLEMRKVDNLNKYYEVLSTLRQKSGSYAASYQQAQNSYEHAYNWYRIKIFALMLVFVAPFFFGSLRIYLRYKRGNSPYTIIAGAVLSASALLFLQIVGMLLYEIIPYRVIEIIMRWFSDFGFVRYILYYLSVILVILLFGGIVYYIQKRVFNPQTVAIRRLKDRKCPKCSFGIDFSMNHCPRCGHAIRSSCATCHEPRFKDLPICQHCGVRD